MRNIVMLSILLLLAACLTAQQYPSQEEGQPSVKPNERTTLDGCLQYDNGQYSLIDGSGMKFLLTGSAKQLKPQIDHEVELNGKPSSRTLDNTPPGGASSVITQYIFVVKSVKRVADICR